MPWLERLNQLKKASGMTTDDIVQKSGVPKGTLNKLFAGQTKDPQLSTIKTVVNSLGYTLDALSEPDEIKNATPEEFENGVIDLLNQAGVFDKEISEEKMKLIVQLIKDVLESDI